MLPAASAVGVQSLLKRPREPLAAAQVQSVRPRLAEFEPSTFGASTETARRILSTLDHLASSVGAEAQMWETLAAAQPSAGKPSSAPTLSLSTQTVALSETVKAAVSTGWDLAFLKRNQQQSAVAANAALQEIAGANLLAPICPSPPPESRSNYGDGLAFQPVSMVACTAEHPQSAWRAAFIIPASGAVVLARQQTKAYRFGAPRDASESLLSTQALQLFRF